jgi:hypothetical protein
MKIVVRVELITDWEEERSVEVGRIDRKRPAACHFFHDHAAAISRPARAFALRRRSRRQSLWWRWRR